LRGISLKLSHLSFGLLHLFATACVGAGEGNPPKPERSYFPVGLAVSEDAEHLYVVNSNFDLQFNQGTIQSLSLERVRELAPVPCSGHDDCQKSEICDLEPSEENRSRPSFLCVDAKDRQPCAGLGEKVDHLLAVSPGRCAPISLLKNYEFSEDSPTGAPLRILVDVLETAAFATQGVLLSRPCLDESNDLVECSESETTRIESPEGETFPERLFVPVRGNTSIYYIDITDDGLFRCGRSLEENNQSFLDVADGDHARRCRTDSTAQPGQTAYNIRTGVTFGLNSAGELITVQERPPEAGETDEDADDEDDPLEAFIVQSEPFDLAASADGRFLVASHQLRGRASTIVNDWQSPPALIHTLKGLPENPVSVAALPTNSKNKIPSFLMTYRTDPQIDLLSLVDDGLAAAMDATRRGEVIPVENEKILRPFLLKVASTTVRVNSNGLPSRGLAVDDRRRRRAVAACAGDESCLEVAEDTALDVYAANRGPNSLLIGKTGGTDSDTQSSQTPSFFDNIPLSAGPSRVVLGHITDTQGLSQERVFVICFDSALIYIYNPDRRIVESVIRTGRGPHSIAFDPENSLAYVGHFADSYVGVVSLDMRHPQTFGSTLLTLGTPISPRAAR